MGFVIISNKRDVKGVTLFMVDRAKQRASFWSDRLDDVKNFQNFETAKAALSKLRFNNPASSTTKLQWICRQRTAGS